MPKASQASRKESRQDAAKSTTKLRGLMAELFRAHWQAVQADFSNGIDVAKNRACFFYAGNTRQALRMARRYYTLARATRFADASIDEVLGLSDAWFGAFQNYVDDDGLEGRQLRDELRQLVAAEYVAVSRMLPNACGSSGHFVAPLPNETVEYGDVYEITTSGYSRGAYLAVCKSVAEPFLKAERSQVMAGIESEFFENAAADGEPEEEWQINFRETKDPRIIEADITPGTTDKRTAANDAAHRVEQ